MDTQYVSYYDIVQYVPTNIIYVAIYIFVQYVDTSSYIQFVFNTVCHPIHICMYVNK